MIFFSKRNAGMSRFLIWCIRLAPEFRIPAYIVVNPAARKQHVTGTTTFHLTIRLAAG